VLPCPCGRVVVLGLNSMGWGYEVRVCNSGTNIRARGGCVHQPWFVGITNLRRLAGVLDDWFASEA
jgi:hypothetical protein